MANNFKRTAHHSLQVDFTSGTKFVENTPNVPPEPWPPAPTNYWINVLSVTATNIANGYFFNVDENNNAYFAAAFATSTTYPDFASIFPYGLIYKIDTSGNLVADYQYIMNSATENVSIDMRGAYYYNNKVYVGAGNRANNSILNGKTNLFILDKNLTTLNNSITYYGVQNKYDGVNSIDVNSLDEMLLATSLPTITTPVARDGYYITKFTAGNTIAWNTFISANTTAGITVRPKAVFLSDNKVVASFASRDTAYTAGIVKFDTDGSHLWTRSFGTTSVSSYTSDIKRDASDNIYAAASIYSTNTYSTLIKFDSDGTIVWQKNLAHPSGVNSSAICLDSNNNIYLTGYNLGDYVSFVVKYDSNGNLLWQRSLNLTVPANPNLGPNLSAINVDLDDNLLIGTATANYSSTATGSDEQYLVMLKVPNDGSLTGVYTVGGAEITYDVTTDYSDSTATWPVSTTAVLTVAIPLTLSTISTLTSSTTITQTVQAL